MNASPKYLLKTELCKAYKIKPVIRHLKAHVWKANECHVDLSVFFLARVIYYMSSFKKKTCFLYYFSFLNCVKLCIATRCEIQKRSKKEEESD